MFGLGAEEVRFRSIWVHHHHLHQSLNLEGRWGTTDDFATSFLHFSLFSTALWDWPNSRPVHSRMLSSHLFLCPPCLARQRRRQQQCMKAHIWLLITRRIAPPTQTSEVTNTTSVRIQGSIRTAPLRFTGVFEHNTAACFVYTTMVHRRPAGLSKEAYCTRTLIGCKLMCQSESGERSILQAVTDDSAMNRGRLIVLWSSVWLSTWLIRLPAGNYVIINSKSTTNIISRQIRFLKSQSTNLILCLCYTSLFTWRPLKYEAG